MEFPNGLKLFWGQENSASFQNDSASTKYKKQINLPVTCTTFVKAFASFQYPIGSDTVGISATSLSSVTLFSNVKVSNFMVNWFAIGI